VGLECEFWSHFSNRATLQGTCARLRCLLRKGSSAHPASFCRRDRELCGPGGVRAVIAENLLLRQQLIVLRRGRHRARNLTRLRPTASGGFGSLFPQSPTHRKGRHRPPPLDAPGISSGVGASQVSPAVLVDVVREKPGPKGPDQALIQAIVALKSRNPTASRDVVSTGIILESRRKSHPSRTCHSSHPFVERLVGTMRRESLDHVLFWEWP